MTQSAERPDRPRVVAQGAPRRRSRVRRALWTAAEGAVTLGLVLLLLVAHQLWWTNRQARAGAERQVQALERQWEQPPPATDDPGAT
ncbi:class E sortase, partial [Streptomyces sp. SID5785]|nr:class E sortase [Streptomyces sp. SID5785]